MTFTHSMAHLTADEIQQAILHPAWCAGHDCIVSADTGDVLHSSTPESHRFGTERERGGQAFTFATQIVRYGVVDEEDSPAALEVTFEHGEMDERIELTMSPQRARDLAVLLLTLANEADALTGSDGLE